MLMLTHSWILRNFLGDACLTDAYRDLFVYNVCPDFLPIHETLTAAITHKPSRFLKPPHEYRKAAFIQFHLMVDDIAHHGRIQDIPVTVFNPDSEGYTYVRGRSLVEPLIDLHAGLGQSVTREQAAYESHMLMEMAFDLHLYQSHEESAFLLRHLQGALQVVCETGLDDFAATVGWFYGVDGEVIRAGLRRTAESYTMPRLERFMTMEGRVGGFARRFGLGNPDGGAFPAIEDLMRRGMELSGDCNDFLAPTLASAHAAGFNPDWM